MQKTITCLLLVAVLVAWSAEALFSVSRSQVDMIKISGGTINPVSADFIINAIDRAEDNQSQCLIIELDTPGGLIAATQDIVKKMLAARVPVIVFVYPSGAGAVSAGMSITIAAHVAVMSPGTNIGAAHPVGMGKTDSADVGVQKATNWWATFNRSIADKRGRNADWIEKAVRQSESITETQALELKVIDFICPDVDSLMILLDGKAVAVDSGTVIMKTKQAKLIQHEMNWRSKILDMISNPSIAYILLMLGILGMYFEFSNPGAILPGVLGGIFLILAFFAMQQLPINVAGILLILFATLLFILEVKVTSYGILTIGGIVSMLLGSLMLFKSTPSLSIHLPLSIILAVTLATSAFFIFAISMALRTHRQKVTTGKEGIVNEIGVAVTNIDPEGEVRIHGEYWKAYSQQKIKKNDKVKVIDVDGLKLIVEKQSNP
ncbi:MAG: nodulation protein NfeD [candidate division KSB1 bacterium]|nr:nodulation protein NfeD [candidate division KSB1 bacterium]MDZ7317787.1 nodulation protein NfeD [candidate division KSB1 bacterium]MDZ7341682.1 nodulation protein NfeD [candidate division KSB1 bacterium]